MATYTFGNDDPAAARMALVAAAYEQASGAFIARHAATPVSAAIDLGCGPGFTTELLRDRCSPRQLVGIDASAHFVALARDRVRDAIFLEADVGRLPLPRAPADVLYARLLLAHLPEPAQLAERWLTQLTPGGTLLVEDLEGIEAPAGPLRDYDRMSAAIVQGAGGVMYAGPLLAGLGGTCVRVSVSASVAARIYLFNVRRWAEDPPSQTSAADLADLDRALTQISTASTGETVSWIVRQLALTA